MENWGRRLPNDDWIYSTFYKNTPACCRFLYAFNYLRRYVCLTHNPECVCVPIATDNQEEKYGKKGTDDFWNCMICSYSKSITHGSHVLGSKKLSTFKVIKLLYKFYQDRTAEQASKDDLSYD